MKKNSTQKITLCAAALFLAIVVFGLIKSAGTALYAAKTAMNDDTVTDVRGAVDSFENRYNTFFSNKSVMRNLFGLTQKLLLKREIGGFALVKNNEGSLFTQGVQIDEEYIEASARCIEAVEAATAEVGGDFLFVQVPYKAAELYDELRYYCDDKRYTTETMLVERLEEGNTPCLDLRQFEECSYTNKTDHHWTIEAAFNSAAKIADNLNERYGLGLDDDIRFYGDMSNYEAYIYPSSFQGALGHRTGKYYVEPEDFTLYVPAFKTMFAYYHFNKGQLLESHSGDFCEALINVATLNSGEEYALDKYGAMLYTSSNESIVMNYLANNEYKALFITHSFGPATIPYLSLYFREMRHLDPQEYRFEDDCAQYIRDYKPDVVLVMYNGTFNVGA